MSADGLTAGLRALVAELVRAELGNLGVPAAPLQPEHITVAEYARRYSVSPSTVRHAIRAGVLPATKIGRAIRIQATATLGRPARPGRRDATARARARLLGSGSVR